MSAHAKLHWKPAATLTKRHCCYRIAISARTSTSIIIHVGSFALIKEVLNNNDPVAIVFAALMMHQS